MSTRFTRALLRLPGDSFAAGITTVTDDAPDVARALEQHAAYAAALVECGLAITILPADPAFPDGTFVEDVALLTPSLGVITRPGAASRAGETGAIATALAGHYAELAHIVAPGTVDGGDICETDSGVLIGVSERTNEAGARQLAALLARAGIDSTVIDIRGCAGLLHLKTGISYLGDGRLAVAPGLPDFEALRRFELVMLSADEAYAANCVRVNDRVLVAAGYPQFEATLGRLGYRPLSLAMSEFRKMDGGLSCLSLRY